MGKRELEIDSIGGLYEYPYNQETK